MRSYPHNSPHAAARIVALALISDGHVCASEERVLDRMNVAGELGLAPAQFGQIVQALCEDQAITRTALSHVQSAIDPAMLTTLMSEVDDPVLRRKVIRLCLAVTAADNHLADGEIALLATLLNAWAPASTEAAV